jgi:hypothetical protein
MTIYFFGTVFLICAWEVSEKKHGPFSGFFPEHLMNGEIDGISMPLAAGIILILLGILLHFGLSGQLRIREDENEEKGILYSSMVGRLTFPLGRVEFRIKNGFFLFFRRVRIVSVVFFDTNDEPKLVIKEHSNDLYIIERYYQRGGSRIPFNVPRKFGSVRTLRQLWLEKGWLKSPGA